METFKMIAGTACFLGIITAIFGSMYPSEKFAKQMKIIFSLVFILSVAKPVISGRISFPDIEETVSAGSDQYSSINDRTYEYFISSLEKNISLSLEAKLNEIDIYPAEIETSINISDSGSISISEVRLVLDDMDSFGKAEECIRRAAESDVRVTAGSRENIVPEDQSVFSGQEKSDDKYAGIGRQDKGAGEKAAVP